MNKINKLVSNAFPQDTVDEWLSDEFQKRLKKVFRIKREKNTTDNKKDEKKYSSYIKFCMGEREGMKKKFPNSTAKFITSELGKSWNAYKKDDPDYLVKHYDYKIK